MGIKSKTAFFLIFLLIFLLAGCVAEWEPDDLCPSRRLSDREMAVINETASKEKTEVKAGDVLPFPGFGKLEISMMEYAKEIKPSNLSKFYSFYEIETPNRVY